MVIRALEQFHLPQSQRPRVATRAQYGQRAPIVRQVCHVQQPVRLPAVLAYVAGGVQGGKPELAPTRVVILSVLEPNRHRFPQASYPATTGLLAYLVPARFLVDCAEPFFIDAGWSSRSFVVQVAPAACRNCLSVAHRRSKLMRGLSIVSYPTTCPPPACCSPLFRPQRLRLLCPPQALPQACARTQLGSARCPRWLARFDLQSFRFPCACRTDLTSPDPYHRLRSGGSVCILHQAFRPVLPSSLLQIASRRNILVLPRSHSKRV
jgi:hypothetical protein